ncbi:MAG TPA: hypothetical protein GX511_00320, partial [Firmicutes bacterium]|nr:hypothetical protein [Bacillota bacterium]
MARPRPLAHKAPALIFAFFLALLFSAPTLAATDSLDLTFSVTSAAPPVFSSEKLAAGVLTTGVNEVALSLSNPSAGNEYAETEVELVLAAVPDQGVARLERKTGDAWTLVDPVETPAGLSYALADTGPLAPGGGLTLELRLTLSGEFRGTTPALTAQVYQVSGETKLLIAGAEKTFALAVQGPETALGPTVPEGNPPVFG